MKLDLATRGKWTLEHDVSQDMSIYIYIFGKNIFIYIHNCKSEVSKTYTIVNALYLPEFYYLLYIILKLYMLRMTENYIFEKIFVIWDMIGIDNIVIK